ncbi:hypothetical protein FPZ54_14940 [Sphingomonas suaedae]|uniref:Uncharacterized protein n=1 Tax=Sphingomonas suaedae TaxID=2599297 RepID=A0A518RIB9_9SPHN|nr:hypothetical protein [Sphingomonas suaedae]QDX27170.1 hypothetical protein FPZ54_14940 [Sphingomonas suaedae]
MARPTRDGFDRIGPFHPYFVWAGVLALDLLIIVFVLGALTALGDTIEDAIWPGGVDLVDAL